jgi:hypothetical protein
MTIFAQSLMFLSSYAPLFVVFALLNTFGEGVPSKVCVALAVIGFLVPLVVLPAMRRIAPQPLHVENAQVRDGDTLAYVATYLVPFAAVAATANRERIALGLFFVMLAILYVRNELFYVNPLLAIFGYRMFQVSTPAGASVVLLGKRRFLKSDTTVNARRLSSYVYWEVKP